MQPTQITRNIFVKGTTTFLLLKGPGTAAEVERFQSHFLSKKPPGLI